MIEIIPAIDLLDGHCVRLTQGAYQSARSYNQNPLEQAKIFEQAGFRRLHIVDLSGAKAGSPQHLNWLEKIASQTTLEIDFGGGIKQIETARSALSAGAAMINIGSLAVKQPEVFKSWLQELGGDKILLAADTKDEKLVSHAWTESAQVTIWDFIPSFEEAGLTQFFCTDVRKDGALQGMDADFYDRLRKAFPQMRITASGGLTSMQDITALEAVGLDGVILGKAWYEGHLTKKDLSHYL